MNNVLETNRLFIKSTKKSDADFCVDLWQDDEIGKYFATPPKEKAADLYTTWKDEVEIYDGCHYFVAVSKESGKYIGTCSTVPNEESNIWDIGYAIHKNYWHQSYATEMLKGLIEFSYNNGARKITASVAVQNLGSNALLRKLGFYVDKESTFKKQGTDIIYDSYIYQIDL